MQPSGPSGNNSVTKASEMLPFSVDCKKNAFDMTVALVAPPVVRKPDVCSEALASVLMTL